MTGLVLAVALEYEAPAECPDRSQFWQRVQQVEPQAEQADAAHAARRYGVRLRPSAAGYVGELWEMGMPASRQVEAHDCGEVAEALALALALSARERSDSETSAAPVASAGIADVSPAAPPPPAAAESAAPARRSPAHLARAAAEPRDARSDERAAEPARWGLSVGGFGWTGATPDLVLGGGAKLERDLDDPLLSVQLDLRAGRRTEPAHVTFVGAAPAVCVKFLRDVVEIAACAGAAIGWLPVKGVEFSASTPGSRSSWWLAPLLQLRLVVPFGGDWFVEAMAEVEHSFIERSYHVKAVDQSFSTAPLTPLFGLAAGARF